MVENERGKTVLCEHHTNHRKCLVGMLKNTYPLQQLSQSILRDFGHLQNYVKIEGNLKTINHKGTKDG